MHLEELPGITAGIRKRECVSVSQGDVGEQESRVFPSIVRETQGGLAWTVL